MEEIISEQLMKFDPCDFITIKLANTYRDFSS